MDDVLQRATVLLDGREDRAMDLLDVEEPVVPVVTGFFCCALKSLMYSIQSHANLFKEAFFSKQDDSIRPCSNIKN